MSRFRLLYALACAGILITTGGCAESATAPEAASTEASANRSKKNPAPAPAPAPGDEEVVTIQSGYLEGGGRH